MAVRGPGRRIDASNTPFNRMRHGAAREQQRTAAGRWCRREASQGNTQAQREYPPRHRSWQERPDRRGSPSAGCKASKKAQGASRRRWGQESESKREGSPARRRRLLPGSPRTATTGVYADDAQVLLESPAQLPAFLSAMDTFAAATGQHLHPAKSRLLPLGSIPPGVDAALPPPAARRGMPLVDTATAMGIPFSNGEPPADVLSAAWADRLAQGGSCLHPRLPPWPLPLRPGLCQRCVRYLPAAVLC